MDFHNFVGLGYYAPSPPQQQANATEAGHPQPPKHYEQQQQPSSVPNGNIYGVYGDHSRPDGVDFVPATGVNTNEPATSDPTAFEAPPPGLPPLPVGLSEPSGPMPAYLKHSQMLPSFPPIQPADGPPRTISIPPTDTTALQHQQQQQLETIQEGRNKALAILKQFGAVKEELDESQVQTKAEIGRSKALAILENQKLQILDDNKDRHLLSLDALPPEEWARRRRASFAKLQQKFQAAIFRNLEYVARVGEERLKAQAKQLKESERYNSEMEAYHAQVLQDRAKAFTAVRNKDYSFSVAGIGTQQRQKGERKRKQGRTPVQDASVAVYVSNLPNDGSASEELMRALFGSYGSLRKIHFYMDKRTGDLKGDALVIYNTSNVDGNDRSQADIKSSIVEAVCSQVRMVF
ncbi:MAG: hypothetical protein SGBAC_009241 [Bacillariaceae sp.]